MRKLLMPNHQTNYNNADNSSETKKLIEIDFSFGNFVVEITFPYDEKKRKENWPTTKKKVQR